MSLFSRIRTVTLAYSNNLLDKAVDMNSIPVVKQYVRDLEDAIDKTGHESAVAAANITVLQSNITMQQKTMDLAAQRARAYLEKNDDVNARLVAARIHDSQILSDSLKEQIGQATINAQKMDKALEQMTTRHSEVMTQLRTLESEDRQAKNLESATQSLKAASSVLSDNGVNDSVDGVGQRIHQRSAVANEEFNRTVGAFDQPADPLKDAAIDSIMAGLRVKV